MTRRSERLSRLVIASPCQESWQTMSADERTRFCSRCQKSVFDFAALEAREIEALVQATQGRLCARITRDRSGRMITREPEAAPFHLPDVAPAQRASPRIAAVVTAILGMTGAGWAGTPPVSPPAFTAPAIPSLPEEAHPSGSGEGVLDGQVVDDELGAPLPGVTIQLRNAREDWKLVAVTDAEGRFQFRGLPSGTYGVQAELEGFSFEPVAGLTLGPERSQITVTGAALVLFTFTLGGLEVVELSLDAAFQESPLVVAAIAGPAVTIEEPDSDGVQYVRTELRIVSVLKGQPGGETLLVDHYIIPGEPANFFPGDFVLALLEPDDTADDGSRVYVSVDPLYTFRPIPGYPRLRPELGLDWAAWQAMSFIGNAANNEALQELVNRAIERIKLVERRFAGDEKRLRARAAAIENELRRQFLAVLSGGS